MTMEVQQAKHTIDSEAAKDQAITHLTPEDSPVLTTAGLL